MTGKGKSVLFLINRLRERLWFRPAVFSISSLVAVFAAGWVDGSDLGHWLPDIDRETVETLLSILAASMLVIATFAVGSMVSAYTAAANSGTPRTFNLVLRDDVSQLAHSTFIAAFIFSVIARVSLDEGYFKGDGHFVIFAVALLVFAMVVLVFVYWVDSIARLGLLGPVIDRAERATRVVLEQNRRRPWLGGVAAEGRAPKGFSVLTDTVGYVQEINVEDLQEWATENDARIRIMALPGTFLSPREEMARVWFREATPPELELQKVATCFTVDRDRVFDQDPCLGFVVLSEIAMKALSPAVNDPGTARKVLQTMLRLLDEWRQPLQAGSAETPFDRVELPAVDVGNLFDGAFTGIGRDGAGTVEVAVALQKTLSVLAASHDRDVAEAALRHSAMALARAEQALSLSQDLEAVRAASPGYGQA
ncbi:DUF2254 domain-containing protein [Marinobacter sp.]|uniref:DUF2254 domain-containing protein n=1 Tax=Marinobacter sp. TaxID=50741 RepID=UPI00356B2EE9